VAGGDEILITLVFSSSTLTTSGGGATVEVVLVLEGVLTRLRLKNFCLSTLLLGLNSKRLLLLTGLGVVVIFISGFVLINFTRFACAGISIFSFSTTASAKRFSMLSVALACARSCSTDWDWTPC